MSQLPRSNEELTHWILSDTHGSYEIREVAKWLYTYGKLFKKYIRRETNLLRTVIFLHDKGIVILYSNDSDVAVSRLIVSQVKRFERERKVNGS